MKNILLHSFWRLLYWSISSSHFTASPPPVSLLPTEIEAINDHFTISSLESTNIDILANDKGNNLKLKEILQYPCCGHLQSIEENGILTYTPKTAGNHCVEDNFIYLIEDEAGNVAMAEAFLQIPPPALIVEIDRDCDNTESTGNYILNISINSGTPPFNISGSINETINDFGIISVTIVNGVQYEIVVIDAVGNEFFEIGGEISCFPLCPIVAIENPSTIGHCTCDGKLVPDLQGFLQYEENLKSIDGYWFDGINEIDFSLGDTIPQNTLVYIDDIWTNYNCYYFKSDCSDGVSGLLSNICTPESYQIKTDYDEVSIKYTDIIAIPVLQNDEGTQLKIRQILTLPTCGEILEVNQATGTVVYTSNSATGCSEDSFIYEVEDACGNVEEGMVYIDIETTDFLVEIERDCSGSASTGRYKVHVFIEGGIPPFSVSGTFNQIFNETGFYSFSLNDGNPYEIWVTDATGNEYYEFGGQFPCAGGCVAHYLTEQEITSVLQCQCTGDLVIDLENLSGIENVTSINGFWHTDEIEHTAIGLGDTIPPNANFWIYNFSTDEYCYYFYSNTLGGLVSNICTPESYQIKTNEDEVFIEPNDTIAIPVLQNDEGTHLQFSQILTYPNCGEILEVNQETGMIRYTSNADLGCSEDSFIYEVEDACGNLEEAAVVIHIKAENNGDNGNNGEENQALIVEIEKDCTDVIESGVYTLDIVLVSGVPPFSISGSINTTLEEVDIVSTIVNGHEPYEIWVEDATGSEFYEQGNEYPCLDTCIDLPIGGIEDIADCLYNGDLVMDFESLIGADSNAILSGYWFNNGINYVTFEQGDTLPSDVFVILDAIHANGLCYELYPQEISGSGLDFCPTPILQARPDFIPAKTNETTTFNLLANDIGEGIFIEQITEMPPCGTLEVIDAVLGTVRYIPNEEGFYEDIVPFQYQIQDNQGNISDTTSVIVKDRGTSEIVVGTMKDCSSAENTGTYIANIAVAKGTPPFVLTGLIDTTLNDFGMVSKELEDGLTYEVHIVDAEGNEASETGGEIACTKLHGSIYIDHLDDLGDCTCDGGFEFFEDEDVGNINGFWYEDGNKHFIEQGTIVPRDTYLEIFEIGLACQYYPIIYHWQTGFTGWVSDFCFNYEFKAEPDFVSTERGDTTEIPILENDKGTNLRLKQVDYSLQCGEILNIDYENGIITYRSHPSTHCEQDQIEYHVVDACGNTKKGIATIDLNHEQNLIVEIERDCTNENETGIYELIVKIVEGKAPFTISGSIHETLEETGSISTEIEDGVPYEIEVIDTDGNEFFEIGGEVGCGAYCQEYQSLHIPNLEAIAECTCEGELLFHFEGIELEEDFEVWGNYSVGGTFSSFEIEANQIVPNDYLLQFSSLYVSDRCYHLWIGNELGFNGKTSDFCPNKVPPTPTIDKYESETYVCGEGEIMLIAEGGGEEAVYHWYEQYNPDYPSGAVPADPPMGQVWVNGELDGWGYIYLVSTDTSGCASKPLEVYYQRYPSLEVENQNVVIDDSCKNYQVSFDIIGGSGLYDLGGEMTDSEFTSNWIPVEENYNFTINDDLMYWLCEPVWVNGTVMPLDSSLCDFTPISNIEHQTPNIQLYPNPSNGNFTLSLQLEQAEAIDMQIMDILGQEKLWQRLQTLPTVERHDFNLDLPSGLYFLQVSGKNWRWTEKVIVR